MDPDLSSSPGQRQFAIGNLSDTHVLAITRRSFLPFSPKKNKNPDLARVIRSRTNRHHTAESQLNPPLGVLVFWTLPGSNRSPPRCKRGALPNELRAHIESWIDCINKQIRLCPVTMPAQWRVRFLRKLRAHTQAIIHCKLKFSKIDFGEKLLNR